MRPLGVVLCSSDYLPNIGGVAAGVHHLARYLLADGHDVTVLAPGRRRAARGWYTEAIDGVPVLRMGPTWLPGDRGGWGLRLRRSEQLYRELRERCGRVVFHWHTDDDTYAPRDPAVARVFSSRISDILRDLEDPPRAARWAAMIARADWVIGISRERQEAAWKLGFPPERTVLLQNGVDTERFKPDPAARAAVRAELGLPADAPVLFCPRRVTPVSGLLDLVHALRHLPAVEGYLVVAGGRSDNPDDYEQQVLFALRTGTWAERFRWVGIVPNRDIQRYYAAADIAVIPSLQEGSSNSILEAMASGLAVLATNVGGNPEHVADGETGLLVASGDPRALAAGLERLLLQADLRQRMGAAGLRRARDEFSWPRIAARTVEIYELALEHAAARCAGAAA